jgi:hypothetical protein
MPGLPISKDRLALFPEGSHSFGAILRGGRLGPGFGMLLTQIGMHARKNSFGESHGCGSVGA